jgi:hypothetical protein
MPKIIPSPKGIRKVKFFFILIELIEYNILSYIFKSTAIVPPLIPGTRMVVPRIIP